LSLADEKEATGRSSASGKADRVRQQAGRGKGRQGRAPPEVR
jgi:hypothetical protein